MRSYLLIHWQGPGNPTTTTTTRNKHGIDIKALDDVNKREAVVQFMTKILPVLP